MEVTETLNIERLEERVAALERVVFGGAEVGQVLKPDRQLSGGSRGPTEGVRDLVSEGFFRMKKRTLREVRNAMEERGFVYSAQAIDAALTRSARRDGALVLLREGGRKIYAERR